MITARVCYTKSKSRPHSKEVSAKCLEAGCALRAPSCLPAAAGLRKFFTMPSRDIVERCPAPHLPAISHENMSLPGRPSP